MLIDGIEEQIARADVLRVDLLDLPGSEAKAVGRGAVRGAVVGLGAAALLAGVIGAEACPPPCFEAEPHWAASPAGRRRSSSADRGRSISPKISGRCGRC